MLNSQKNTQKNFKRLFTSRAFHIVISVIIGILFLFAVTLFPATLAAMGFKIEGNRIGLGTNMFSYRQTLVEKPGV